MKRYKGIELIISGVAIILVVIFAAVMGILKTTGVIETDVSAFLIMLTILTLGIGGYLIGFAIVKKGGYELAVGGILFIIGVALLFVCLDVDWVINLIVCLSLLIIAFVSLFLLKAPRLTFTTSDKEEGYVPYMEKLAQEKEREREAEEELPEIKSFKD